MGKTLVVVGPEDHGRRMSLDDFEHAEVIGGHVYELGRGTVVVSDVPVTRHLKQFLALRDCLLRYQLQHPAQIHAVIGGGECKILAAGSESDRHPDLAVYFSAPPDGEDIWSTWIADIVVEIVSPGSERRDYDEKPDEYLAFGVKEYWIVDAPKGQMTVMRRLAGRWATQVVPGTEKYKTRLLRDFELDLVGVFAAAREAAD